MYIYNMIFDEKIYNYELLLVGFLIFKKKFLVYGKYKFIFFNGIGF